jgi:transcriptional regulator NrdR family protein
VHHHGGNDWWPVKRVIDNETVTTAIITAGSALLGVILGQLLSRAAEHRRWFRQQLHEACVRLLTAAETARVEFVYVAAFRPAVRKQFESDDIVSRIQRAANEAGVDLPDMDASAMQALLRRVEQKVTPAVYREFGRDSVQQLQKAREVMEQVTLARNAVQLLGPKPVVQASDRLASIVIDIGKEDLDRDATDELHKTYLDARSAFVESARQALIPKNSLLLFRERL